MSGYVNAAHEALIRTLGLQVRDLEHQLAQVTAERDALQKAVLDWDKARQACLG